MGNRRTLIKCGYFTSVLPGEAVWEPGTVKHNQKKEGPEMPWAERAAGFHSGPEARKFPPARSFRENRKQNGGGNFETGGPEEIRTLDLSDANRTLSQLSYRPNSIQFYAGHEKSLGSRSSKAFLCPGGDKRDRTADLLNAIQALSQLSYTPVSGVPHQNIDYNSKASWKCQGGF